MSSFNWSKGNLNDLQRTWRTADGENSADYRNDSLKSDILVSDRMSFKSTVTLQHLPPLSGGSSSDPVRFGSEENRLVTHDGEMFPEKSAQFSSELKTSCFLVYCEQNKYSVFV